MDMTSIFSQIDSVAAVAIVSMVVAVVELVKNLCDKNWRGALIIFVSGVVGLLGGLALGANLIYSAVLGFAASGVYKLAQTVRPKQKVESTNS